MSDDYIELLAKACRQNDTTRMQSIITDRPDLIDKGDSFLGWGPLHRTVVCEHNATTELLLSLGADPNIRTRMGETPVYQAVSAGLFSILELLLKHNADPNLVQNDGNSPLHISVKKDFLEISELLLSHGADASPKDILFGRTPLHYAIEQNSVDHIKLLLHFGASVDAQDADGSSPTDLATTEVLEVLQTYKNKDSPVQDKLKAKPETPSKEVTSEIYSIHRKIRETVSRHQRNYSTMLIHEIKQPETRPRTMSSGDNERQDKLLQWLKSFKLECLFSVLMEAGYDDFDQLLAQKDLPEEVLESIGIEKVGLRRRFLTALHEEKYPNRTPNRRRGFDMFKCCAVPISANSELHSLPTLDSWLKNLSLAEYYWRFLNAGFDDLEQVLALMKSPWPVDDNVLKGIGIEKKGHRHRIVSKLKEDSMMVKNLKQTRRNREATPRQDGSSCILM